jgi:hypothetical protein
LLGRWQSEKILVAGGFLIPLFRPIIVHRAVSGGFIPQREDICFC